MSFPPPRPPMGMPPMNHMGMPGYGYPPVGMMPMPMGMMPMMRQTVPTITTSTTLNTSTNSSHHKANKKLVPQEIPKADKKDEKPPVTTVFVGNISDRAPDAMIRQMLQRCGNVLSWKRVQGASGKLQAFGFCEYEEPEATLRCIRLLNEWQISDKKLVVKVDAKTKALLDEYKTKKQEKEKREGDKAKEADDDKEDKDREEGEVKENDKKEDTADELDEFTLREDRVAKAGLDAIMREYANDLAKKPPPEYSSEEKKEHLKKKKKESEQIKDSGLDDMELEDDKKELINKEIRSFRDAHKDEEEKEKAWEKEREQLRRKREEDRERERDRQREKEKEKERKERERMIKDRSKTRSRSRSRSRSRDRDRNIDEEDDHERRKLERKLREKETAYQELLKKWEARERKKTREYEKEQDREEDRKSEEVREARRLKEFLEDYDDERDDHKYYKGSALQRRLKEREKEMEADERDRQREREEIEDIRRRLLEKGHPDPEGEMARIERERDEHLMPRLHKIIVEKPPTPEPEPEPQPEEKPSKMQPTLIPIEPANTVSSQSSAESDTENLNIDLPSDSSDGGPSPLQTFDEEPFIGPAPQQEEPEKEPIKPDIAEIKNGNSNDSPAEYPSKRKMTVKEVFNQDEEESSAQIKKRKLIPLDYSEEEKAAVSQSMPPMTKPTTAEEKRRCIKNLIEKIPTAKEELFAYSLDWTMVDGTLMDRRIKPWVNKKIVEYIGEEEPTLTDFICQKVMAHSTPQMILGDVAMVLDEEAEVFVVKMWRLLIYEAEAKKLGLVK